MYLAPKSIDDQLGNQNANLATQNGITTYCISKTRNKAYFTLHCSYKRHPLDLGRQMQSRGLQRRESIHHNML